MDPKVGPLLGACFRTRLLTPNCPLSSFSKKSCAWYESFAGLVNHAPDNLFDCLRSPYGSDCTILRSFLVGDSDMGKLSHFPSQRLSTTRLVSFWIWPSLSCMAETILSLLGCRRSVCTTVGVDPVITRHLAACIMITWCSRRNSITRTTSKSSMPTTTKSIRSLHPLNCIATRFTTSTMGKAVEFTAFIFPVSFFQWRFNRLASATVIKLWVAPESTIVLFACLRLIQMSTYIRPPFVRPLVSPAFFWRDDKSLMASTLTFWTPSLTQLPSLVDSTCHLSLQLKRPERHRRQLYLGIPLSNVVHYKCSNW